MRTSHAPGLIQKIFSRPSFPAGANVTGVLHFIERVLDGFGKVAGVPGDGSGMAGLVSEKPGDDLRTGIHPEERTQAAEQIGSPAWIRRLAHAAAFHGIAQQAVAEEIRIRLVEDGKGAAVEANEERLRFCRDRQRIGKCDPFSHHRLSGKSTADRGKHAQVSHRTLVVDAAEPLEVDALAVRAQPIDHLVEQTRVVAAIACGGQQEGLGIDDAVVIAATLPSDPKRGPLAP